MIRTIFRWFVGLALIVAGLLGLLLTAFGNGMADCSQCADWSPVPYVIGVAVLGVLVILAPRIIPTSWW